MSGDLCLRHFFVVGILNNLHNLGTKLHSVSSVKSVPGLPIDGIPTKIRKAIAFHRIACPSKVYNSEVEKSIPIMNISDFMYHR